ncbi:hypothetical protein RM553_04265 [Zunongwangia sp. F363]|uniref:DUF5017 domain-containing protein n=1 Tax=Autumnicola tepida TaxID=3075595 RepID=A0ABU3C7J5_9FLAO|nr:hypothetical protein [Zunongwangia sp. F363]MDT0642040.1 hypothetical protein [Zunongwangia sp. F363]
MKKVYLIFALLGTALFSCEPMDDLQAEANEVIDNTLTAGEASYTLAEEDYEAVGIDATEGFNSYEQAQTLVPDVLNNAFPVYQNGTSIITSFNVYDPIVPTEYSVTEEDYAAVENEVGYFVSTSKVQDFLEYKFEGAENGDIVELTYNAVANEITFDISAEDFDLIEEELGDTYPDAASSAANYSNFDRREGTDAYWSNDMILEAINVVLLENLENVEGQPYNVSYAIFDGSAGTESMTVEFNGNKYVPAAGVTSYEITDADFDLIGERFADEYPEPASSAANYNNFDIRNGNPAYWNEVMILEALNVVLSENFEDAEEGAMFEVSYATYSGSSGTGMISVIKEGDEYIINTNPVPVATVETTNVFAYTGDSWNMPITLTSENYTEMGQSEPIFDDEEEALYKIGIYLGRLYPYALSGSSAVVAYNLDSEESIRYTLFTLQDGEWLGVPQVIEATLQFAKTDGVWVPDNTIKYSLTGSDYGTIAAALEDEYPDPVSSMENYSNFDRRNGNAAYWSDEMLEEAMIILLNSIAPNAEVGQKYEITYDVYNGSNITETITLIKNDAGNWVRFVED